MQLALFANSQITVTFVEIKKKDIIFIKKTLRHKIDDNVTCPVCWSNVVNKCKTLSIHSTMLGKERQVWWEIFLDCDYILLCE